MRRTARSGVFSVALATLLFSVGCGSRLPPVMAPRTELGAVYSAVQVEQAILSALARRHWLVVQRAPGSITADVDSRGRYAKVLIRYNEAGWVIDRLESSPNLKWRPDPPPAGSIHPYYNRWVQKLDDEIRKELGSVLAEAPPMGAPPPPQPQPADPYATQPAGTPPVNDTPGTAGGETPAGPAPATP